MVECYQVCRSTPKSQLKLLLQHLLVLVSSLTLCLPEQTRIVSQTVYVNMVSLSYLGPTTVPSEPKNPEVKVINETAVMMFWLTPDNPNGIIREYQVIYTGYKLAAEEKVITLGVTLSEPILNNVLYTGGS